MFSMQIACMKRENNKLLYNTDLYLAAIKFYSNILAVFIVIFTLIYVAIYNSKIT